MPGGHRPTRSSARPPNQKRNSAKRSTAAIPWQPVTPWKALFWATYWEWVPSQKRSASLGLQSAIRFLAKTSLFIFSAAITWVMMGASFDVVDAAAEAGDDGAPTGVLGGERCDFRLERSTLLQSLWLIRSASLTAIFTAEST